MNIFDPIRKPQQGSEIFETLYEGRGTMIERILSNRVETGEWYDQEHDEWIMLVQGDATLEFDARRTKRLKAGECLLIPAHTRHRVLSTSEDAIWLAVHLNG